MLLQLIVNRSAWGNYLVWCIFQEQQSSTNTLVDHTSAQIKNMTTFCWANFLKKIPCCEVSGHQATNFGGVVEGVANFIIGLHNNQLHISHVSVPSQHCEVQGECQWVWVWIWAWVCRVLQVLEWVWMQWVAGDWLWLWMEVWVWVWVWLCWSVSMSNGGASASASVRVSMRVSVWVWLELAEWLWVWVVMWQAMAYLFWCPLQTEQAAHSWAVWCPWHSTCDSIQPSPLLRSPQDSATKIRSLEMKFHDEQMILVQISRPMMTPECWSSVLWLFFCQCWLLVGCRTVPTQDLSIYTKLRGVRFVSNGVDCNYFDTQILLCRHDDTLCCVTHVL